MRFKIIQIFFLVLFSTSIVFSQIKEPDAAALQSFYANLANAQISGINPKKQIKLKDLEADTIIVVFFASWCRPCVFQAEEVNRIKKEFSRFNLQAVGIGIDVEERKEFKKLAASREFDYLVGEISDSETESLTKELLKITKEDAIPYTILINKGEIKDIFVGAGAGTNKRFKESLGKLIDESNNRTN